MQMQPPDKFGASAYAALRFTKKMHYDKKSSKMIIKTLIMRRMAPASVRQVLRRTERTNLRLSKIVIYADADAAMPRAGGRIFRREKPGKSRGIAMQYSRATVPANCRSCRPPCPGALMVALPARNATATPLVILCPEYINTTSICVVMINNSDSTIVWLLTSYYRMFISILASVKPGLPNV